MRERGKRLFVIGFLQRVKFFQRQLRLPARNRGGIVQRAGRMDHRLYLVDVFDNMLLLSEMEDCALLDPIPYRPTPTPPVIPDRIDPTEKTATVSIPIEWQVRKMRTAISPRLATRILDKSRMSASHAILSAETRPSWWFLRQVPYRPPKG